MGEIMKASFSFGSVLVLGLSLALSSSPKADPASLKYEAPNLGPQRTAEYTLRWKANLLGESGKPVCRNERGEEIGWLISPLLSGYYYGYLATKDPVFVKLLVVCAEAMIQRAVKEPDGYFGWPKVDASGTPVDDLDKLNADSLLGEAMAMRPIVLLSKRILERPDLRAVYGANAEAFIGFAETIFEKWRTRGAWRDTKDGGAISIVVPFGLTDDGSGWTANYDRRNDTDIGFSHPDNKANMVAKWMLAMFDVTGKPVYRELAEKWFVLMRSRLTRNESGGFKIWNYWQPAGPWDYTWPWRAKHWIGVHPNAGYYEIDVSAMVSAFRHGVVFRAEDISALIATGLSEKRYWPALAPYNEEIRQKFEEQLAPESWPGLTQVPWRLALQAGERDIDPP